MEKELTEALGTRVAIETKEHGGKLSIDFMSEDDLRVIFRHLAARIAASAESPAEQKLPEQIGQEVSEKLLDDRTKEEIIKDENTFDPNSFSL